MSSFRRKPSWPRRLLRLALALLVLAALLAAGLWLYGSRFHPEREDVPGQRAELATRRVQPQLARVDGAQLVADLKTLADPAMEGRKVGTPGGARARAYVVQRFREIGLAPVGPGYDHAFTFTPRRGIAFWRAKFWQARPPVHGVNVIGQVRGTVEPDKVIVVSAHYDHLGRRGDKLYPGADDNASGVAALLATARWFRAHPPRHTIVFAAFDGEESGLQGARAFVEAPPVPREAIVLNLNYDMLARSKVNELFASGLYANPHLQAALDGVRGSAPATLLYGHDHPRPFWDMDDWTRQSDQGVFHDAGIAFVYFGVEDHPDYHRPGDTFERIDRDFYVRAADLVVGAAAALDALPSAALRKPAGAD
jgi:hypothetical protein